MKSNVTPVTNAKGGEASEKVMDDERVKLEIVGIKTCTRTLCLTFLFREAGSAFGCSWICLVLHWKCCTDVHSDFVNHVLQHKSEFVE